MSCEQDKARSTPNCAAHLLAMVACNETNMSPQLTLPIMRLATTQLPPGYRLATTGYTGYHRSRR